MSTKDRTADEASQDELAHDRTIAADSAEAAPDTEPDRAPVSAEMNTAYVDEAPTADAVARALAPELPDRGGEVGRFVVLDRLGQGGFGVVLAAYDPELDRKVALKLIHPGLFRQLSVDDARQRLLREARALARLAHPNIVAVHEIGTIDDAVFIAMEFVPGKTLRGWMSDAQPSREEILEVFVAAGRGLAAAHRAGIVHRDFKPDNVMISDDGRVRVLDFGLARAAGELPQPPPAERPRAPVDGASLEVEITRAGAILGTPAYMAPEQHQGKPADERSDQFGYCVALYEALYRQRPFPGDTLTALTSNVIDGKLRPPPADAGVPPSIERAVLRGLSVAPDDRHPSMDALLEQLERSPVREAEDLLVGRWDEAARSRVRDAFARVGTDAARDVAARVEEMLDRWAEAWAAAYADARARQADAADGRAHARAAWLLGRLDELAALAEVFAEADATVVDHAIEACHQLPPVARGGHSGTSAPPPPSSPELRAQVTRVRLDLARARTLGETGKYAAAHELAGTVLESARRLDYPPLLAEALATYGEQAARRGEHAAAEESLVDAVAHADASAHDEVRAAAACALVALVGDRRARPDDGMAWARTARAIVERIAGRGEVDPELSGRIRLALARVLLRGGDYAAARGEAETAADELATALGDDHPQVADALTAVGDAQRQLGDWRDAESTLERALAIRTRALGADHPHLAESLAALGVLLAHSGDYSRALGYHQRACAVAEAALDPDHSAQAGYLENLGEAYALLGRHGEALAPLERALSLRERALGEHHPDVAAALTQLGRVRRATGQYADARVDYERALAIRLEAHGDDHPEVAAAHNNLGMVLMSLGDHPGALAHHERALAIRIDRLGPDHPVTANSHTNVGRAAVPLGKLDRARQSFERALAIWRPIDHPFQAYALAGLGALELAANDRAAAERAYRDALAVRERALGTDHVANAELLRGLAEVLAPDRAADAEAALVRAEALLAAAHPDDHPDLAACRSDLAALRSS